MKKTLSLIMTIVLLLPTALNCIAADEVHTHSGTLQNIVTDKSVADGMAFCGEFLCDSCGEKYYASVTPSDIGMPILNIEGSTEGISKENEVGINVSYMSDTVNFSSAAFLKWQGGSSLDYEKKNYTLKLTKEDGSKNKIKIVDSWGKQSKYCLKANWVDQSHARNIVSARIFGDIVRSRCLDDELEKLPNGGAVDGFPVALYQNGIFYGLYTFNIPKDKWAWGMSDETLRQALIFGDTWSDAVRLNRTIADVTKPEDSGFEIEYCSTEDDPEVGTQWAIESFNRFISFLKNTNDSSRFKAGISEYTSVERAIDVLIFTYFIHADDNMAKNIVWATYDGTKWIPCMYDMDATWGLFWEGSLSVSPKGMYFGGGNMLFSRLTQFYPNEITARYKELRENILSKKSIEHYFSVFFDSVTDVVKSADARIWPDAPSRSTNNFNSIYSFATTRLADFDNHYYLTIKEKSRYANKVMFDVRSGCQFYVYPFEDYTVRPVRASNGIPVNSDGSNVKTTNEVNFLVVPPEGYTLDGVYVKQDSGYSELLGPDITGRNNVYRIKSVTDYIDVAPILTEIPSGYDVSFDLPDGVTVSIFPGSDYTITPTVGTSAVSVDGSTGIPTKSGDGQVNFTVNVPDGFEIETVEVSPKNYKNLKTPEDTGVSGTYRITKITGDITVTVTLKEGHTHRFSYGKCTICDIPDPDFVVGDINMDMTLTSIDSNLMLKAIAGSLLLPEDKKERADINKDLEVTPIDANLIKKMIAGN